MANKQIRYGIGFDVDKTGLQELRAELNSLNNITEKDLKIVDSASAKQELAKVKADINALGDAIEQAYNPKLGTINVDTFNKSLRDSNTSIKQVEASFSQLGPRGAAAFRNMTAEIFTTQKAVKQTSGFIDSMAKTLFNTLKWSVASGAINTVASSIRNAWNYTKSLDTSLNDIRIVTEKSAEEMDKFAVRANKAAKALGAQTTAYTKASLIYYQQGLAEEDVQARTDVTMKAANVTGQSAAEVSEQLTAVWNGYRVVAEEAELYVDKLSAVAASTAADLQELSEGMSKVASGANAMGVDIDQLTAQLSTIISVTRQDASSVGTALKTIFARMGDLKVDGVDEFGVSLGEVSGTLQKVGVEVLDLQGNLRPMGEVMEEVAGKWGHWTEAQQQAVAVAMAGKRQYNNLLALFENWDMYESALTTSETSEGTLQKQQDIYMESLEAKLQQLSTSGERIYKSIFDSDSMKDFIDVLTVGLDGVGSFIDGIGGGGNLLLGIVSILGHRFSNEIAKGIGMAAHNMGVLRENALQARAEAELMEKYSDASEEAIQKMTALKTEQLKAEKLLTEEEREQYDYLIKQTAELYNQKDALEQEKAGTDSFIKENLDKEIQSTGRQFDKLTDKDKLGIIQGQINKYESEANESYPSSNITALKKRIKDKSDLGSVDEDINNTAKGVYESFEAARSGGFLVNEGLEQAEQAVKELELAQSQLNDAIQEGTGVEEARTKVLQKTEKLNNSIKSSLKKSKTEYEKHKKVLEENAKAQERNNRAIADNEKISKSLTKSVNFKAMTQGATELVSSTGMMVTSLTSVINAFKVLGDESLSDGEKFLQFVSAFGMGLPMLISSGKGVAQAFSAMAKSTGTYNTVLGLSTALSKAETKEAKEAAISRYAKILGIKLEKKELNELTKEKNENVIATLLEQKAEQGGIFSKMLAALASKIRSKATDAETAATNKGTVANIAFNASLGVILVAVLAIVAAIAFLIIGTVALVNHFKNIGDNGKAAFEKASKAAQMATERFNETKQAFEDLKKSIEDYDKAQKAIDEMTKGTDEWKEAIQEANAQVVDLIDKYPELAKYISNVDGRLTISEEGKEAVLKNQTLAVESANRGKIVANIEKNKAENNMIRQEGANKVLKTDDYAGGAWGVGAAGAAVGAATGALIGSIIPVIGTAAGAIIGTVVGGIGAGVEYKKEGERREEAYSTALDVIEKNGNSILGSKERFKEEMKLAGVGEDLISILWENKEELAKNSAAIIANNKANKIQQQQIAANYLQDKSEIYQESKNQSAISKIIAQNAGTDSQAYKDELAALGGDDGISKKEAEDVFNQSGIKGTFKKAEDGVITYLDENNEEKQIGADALAQQVAQEKALAKVGEEGSIQEIEETLNKVSQNFGNNFGEAASKAVTSFVAGETGDLSSLTEESLSKISNDPNSYKITDEQAKILGYENAEAYAKAFENAIANYNYELDNITTGLNRTVTAAFNSLDTTNWSLATQKAVANSLENAFKNSGPSAVSALKDLYANIGDSLSEEDMQALTNVAGKIDWSSSSALLDFKNQLTDLGIEIDSGFLENFASKMAGLVNPIGEVINNLDNLRSRLKEIGDLTKDLKLGQTISDEDYKNLIKYNKELAKYFVVTADGYKYLGGAEEEIKKTKKSQLNIDNLKEQFANAETQGADLLKTGIFDKNAKTKTSQKDSVENLIRSGKYNDLLAASGYDVDQVLNAINTAGATQNINGKTYTLEKLAKMSEDDLVEATGVDPEEALRIIEGAKGQIETSDDIIYDVFNAVSGNLLSIEEGTFDKNLDNALTTEVSALAKSYNELQEYRNMMTKSSYENLAKVYLAEEAEALGVNTKLWEKLSNSMSLDEQDQYINNLHKIQSYKEIDYYKTLDKEIENVTDSLDKLAETQEKLLGKDVLDNFDKQIAAQKKLISLEDEKLEKKKEQWALEQHQLGVSYSTENLSEYGIAGISFNQDGTVNESFRQAIVDAILNSDNEEDIAFLKSILDEIDDFNNDVEEGIENHAEAIRKAYQEQADLLIEKFNTQIQITLDLDEAKREWEEFSNSIYQSGQGLKFFDEESATDIINRAITRSESLTGSFNTVISGIESRNRMYEEAQIGVSNISTYDPNIQAKESALSSSRAATKTAQENYDKEEQRLKSIWDAANDEYLKKLGEKDYLQELYSNRQDKIKAYKTQIQEKKSLDLFKKELEGVVSSYVVYGEKYDITEKIDKEFFSGDDSEYAAYEFFYKGYMEKLKDYSKYSEDVNESDIKDLENLNKVTLDEINALNIDTYKNAADAAKAAYDALSISSLKQTLVDAKNTESQALQDLETAKQAKTDYVNNLKATNSYVTQDEERNFIRNDAAYKEDMDKWMGTAQDYYEQLQDEAKNVYEAYFTAQEEIMGLFDESIEKLSSMNNILSSQAELMKLVGKNTKGSGAQIASLYTSMRENSEKNFALAKLQLEAAQVEYDKIIKSGSEEQIATVTENLQKSTENMLSMASEYSTALAEEYGAALTGIIDDYLKEVSGRDLESLTQDWELATDLDERYLDEVNSSYAMDELSRKYQKSIDETDSYSAQKKLNEAKQKELEILEKKGKLSQYDIDRANAMYELTLKQIALEEAQNTANKMKLTRDASGNYSYQYVADQDSIAKAEEELAKAQNDLYNMDKERQKSLVDDYYSIMQEAQDKISAAVAAGDTERVAKLQEYYFGTGGLLEGIKGEMSIASANFTAIGEALEGSNWVSPFKAFVDTVTENTDFQNMITEINKLTGDSVSNTGVIGTLNNTAKDLKDLFVATDSPLVVATKTLENSISTSLNALGSNLSEAMDASTLAITALVGADGKGGILKQMDTLGAQLKAIGEDYQNFLKTKIDDSQTTALNSNTAATQELTNAMLSYLDKLDGQEDGKYGKWERDRNGDWIFDQNGGTNP